MIKNGNVKLLNEEEIANALKLIAERITAFGSFKFDEEDGLIDFSGQQPMKLSNAAFVPTDITEYVQVPSNTSEKKVVLDIIVSGNALKGFRTEVPYEELASYDYQNNVDVSICCSYQFKNPEKEITSLIKRQIIALCIKQKYVLTTLGWSVIDGKHIYCAGNHILGDTYQELDLLVAPELEQYQFQSVNSSDNIKDIENYLNLYLTLNKNKTPLLLSYFVLSLAKPLFEEAEFPIKFAFFLTGENQSYKTTLATYGTALYNRVVDIDAFTHNLSGTEARLHQVLSREKDMVSLIDDLCRSDSTTIMREQEKKISSLIFAAANNVGRETMNYTNSINALMLFCGEYVLSNPSTNNRLIAIQLEKDEISKSELTKFQSNRAVLSQFAEKFIEWCSKNWKEIVDSIKFEYQCFRLYRQEEEAYQERLHTHYATLDIAYKILLDYCIYEGITLDVNRKDFSTMLSNNFYNQIELLELEAKEQPDYVMMAFSSLKDNEDDLVFEKIKIKNCWKKPIFLDASKSQICIPSGVLTELVQNYDGKIVKVYDIANQFDMLGLLVKDNNKAHSRTKKVHGKRAYVIHYERWHSYIEENYC